MKFVIIYSSRFGNGKKCVDTVVEKLQKKGHGVQIIDAREANPADIPPADVYIFSGATEAFQIAVGIRHYLKKLSKMEGKKYALISTHRMDRAIALKKMEKLLSKKKKMEKVSTIDFKVAGDVDNGNGLPEGYKDSLKKWVDGIS
jgi:flavodoxin